MRAVALTAILATFSAAAYAALAPGESLQRDPSTGNYVVTYTDDEGGAARSVYEPHTKLNPRIFSSFKTLPNDMVEYRYRMTNAPSSAQMLGSIDLDPVSNLKARRVLDRSFEEFDANDPALLDKKRACKEAMAAPSGWMMTCMPSRPRGLNLGWLSREETGSEVSPGASLEGFGLLSMDLPGVITAEMSALTRGWIEGSDPACCDISEELDRMLTGLTTNDSLSRFAAVPAIEIPVPFDGAVLVQRMRNHVSGWKGKDLLAPDVFAQVDALLIEAEQSLKSGDKKKARKTLQDVRQALAHKYGDLEKEPAEDNAAVKSTSESESQAQLQRYDRRLAARVLDFDVKFVQQRIGD